MAPKRKPFFSRARHRRNADEQAAVRTQTPATASQMHDLHDHAEEMLLHGSLFVYVRRASMLGQSRRRSDDEPSKKKVASKVSSGVRVVGKKMVNMLRATNRAAQKLVTRELGAYVEVVLCGDVVAKTDSRVDDRRSPNWNEAFNLDLCHLCDMITLKVKDRAFVGPNMHFGEVYVSASELLRGERMALKLELVKPNRQHYSNGWLEIELHFQPLDIVAAENMPPEVPICYFAAHHNCRITLYQDAHQEPGSVPTVPLRTCQRDYAPNSTMLAEAASGRMDSRFSLREGSHDVSDSEDESEVSSSDDSLSSSEDLEEVVKVAKTAVDEHGLHQLIHHHHSDAEGKGHHHHLHLKPAHRKDGDGKDGGEVVPEAEKLQAEDEQPEGGKAADDAKQSKPAALFASARSHFNRFGRADKGKQRTTLTGPDGLALNSAASGPGGTPRTASTGASQDGDAAKSPSPRGTQLGVSPVSTDGAARGSTADSAAHNTPPAMQQQRGSGSTSGVSPSAGIQPSPFAKEGDEASTAALQRLGISDVYEVRSCWQDLHQALLDAEDFIYIAGWSIYPWTRLTRPGGEPLGELLKRKAQDGVVVCMLVWDDKSSINLPGVFGNFVELIGGKPEGMMETHDEITRSYFQGSKVACEVIQRSGGKGNRIGEATVASAFFTHHQKAVVCDAPPNAGAPYRTLQAFVGGIDLTTGRYDTAKHPILSEHDSPEYHEDWQNKSAGKGEQQKVTPREGWHDTHCRIEGPACRDVMRNFEERWLRQVGENRAHELFASGAGHIGASLPAPYQGQGAGATIQILRSIDGRSALLDRGQPFPALHYKKGRPVDASCQTAMIYQIRRARHFIYIENQYFMGSSFMWRHDRKYGCYHVIPAELTAKICSKIRRNERFCVYVVMPLHPQGAPGSEATQLLMRFQANTMSAMYREIASALEETRPDHLTARTDPRSPQDYLMIMTLGNREKPGEPHTSEMDFDEAFSDFGADRKESKGGLSYADRAALSRRFMIYVHAKLMIVDDEVAIVGSANINMRSLAGTRDTEIAACIFQRHHLCPDAADASRQSLEARERSLQSLPEGLPEDLAGALVDSGGATPNGVVHHFRVSLFSEHMHKYDDVFRWPASLACVRHIRATARKNWTAYNAPEPSDLTMTGHYMMYPVDVLRSGRVVPLKGAEFLPDTDCRILPKGQIQGKFKLPATLVT